MIDFLPDNLPHIFGERHGHLKDTPANRRLLLDLVNDPANYVGKDKFGHSCYSVIERDDSQLWAVVFAGTLRNGGRNRMPWIFKPADGFRRPRRETGE